MIITQKNKYAIRAVFELARRVEQGPIKTAEIARAQKIPVRFLEVILSQLTRNGMVSSKRGYFGGYTLMQSPDAISVGDIIRMMDSAESLHCVSCVAKNDCGFEGDCAFLPMWEKAQGAMLKVLDTTTIQHLIDGKIP